MKKIAAVLIVLFLSVSAIAQNIPPILVTEGDKGGERLSLAKVAVEVEIFGFLAETKMTMTFRNPYNRQLAGDFYFPLPEGAMISGYALDINSIMVDGVVVEKEKGRIVFEKIVRQGIDPGLVEWVKGNNFRTRVFPIPARGSRTVMVRYISQISFKDKSALYRLPLNFSAKVGEFSLRIEVIKALAKPVVKEGGPGGLQFNRWHESYMAQTSLKNVSLAADLVVGLPEIDRLKAIVEKGADGDYYFFIHDLRPEAGQEARQGPSNAPERITILWDNSGSRGRVSHDQELKILRAYFEKNSRRTISVDLIFFSHEKTKARHFKVENGQAQALLEAIEKTDYDGGTQMSAPAPGKGDPVPDFFLLFTDGLSNFGRDDPGNFEAPVYIFSGDSQSNHVYLRSLAQRSGGEYFNLSEVDEKTAGGRIGLSPFSFLSATCASGTIADIYPQTPQPVQDQFILSGKLQSEKAEIVLNYGRKNKGLQKSTFTISKNDAVDGHLLGIVWAQKKIQELMIFQEKNRNELLETGRKFGLVTSGTSLIVLDNLAQYVEHEIVPPESLPELRKEYWNIIEHKKKDDWKNQQDKLERILQLWKAKVAWWKQDFKYPDGFKFEEKKKTEERRREDVDRAAPRPKRELSEGVPPPPSAKPAGAPLALTKTAGKEDIKEKEDVEETGKMGEPAISIKEWNPDTPYMTQLRKARENSRFMVYLEQKKVYGDSPAFFLDCADFFFKNGQQEAGLRILSNIAEMELENAQLLRVLGHKLAQLDHLDLSVMIFEDVLKLKPEEPQSYRDLALILARLKKYKRAVDLLYHVVLSEWDRFEEIELVALVEMNNIIAKANREGIKAFSVDPRLVQLLDVDVRIILTWDTDETDMDLWVFEPSGEKAFYGNKLTTIGGTVSRDFTDGYGPEEYLIKKGMYGVYKIQANYYGSRAPSLVGAVTLQVEVFTNYGRPNEKRKAITLRLTEKKEVINVGEIEF